MLVELESVETTGRDMKRPGWRSYWPFHLAFAAVLAAIVGYTSQITWPMVVLPIWALAYLASFHAYAVKGSNRAGQVMVVLSVVFAITLHATSTSTLPYFITFPLIWFFATDFRQGITATVVLGLAMFIIDIVKGLPDGSWHDYWLQSLIIACGSVGFSCFIALWMLRYGRLTKALQQAQADLAQAEHERGVTEERARMAAEIHDTLAQEFTSIGMLVQSARLPGANVAERLDLIEQSARTGLAESRQLIAAAHESFDLVASLHRLAEQLAQRCGIDVQVQAEGWLPVGARREVVLLRATQEALHNIEKHAQASAVQLILTRTNTVAHLEVRDNGVGFDVEGPTGFGLAGLRRRVQEENGTMELTSSPGGGSGLIIELPVEES